MLIILELGDWDGVLTNKMGNRPMSVRFQVLTAASMKIAVFWAVAPCFLVEVYRRFKGAYCLHNQSDDRPDYEGSKHL
jgi:hypothetical protein